MKEKKHIDELFKEQLQNYEAAPSPAVWTKIQTELKKDKEARKVIPIWWKLAGVAAVIALLLTVGNGYFNPSDPLIDPTLVNEDVPLKIEKDAHTIPNGKDAVVANSSKEDGNLTTDVDVKEDSENNPSKFLQNKIENPTSSKESAVVNSENIPEGKNKASDLIKKEVPAYSANTNDAVANSVENRKSLENSSKNITTSQEGIQKNDAFIKKEFSKNSGTDAQETGVVSSEKAETQKSIDEKVNDRNALIKKEVFEGIEAKEAVAQTGEESNGALKDKGEKYSSTEEAKEEKGSTVAHAMENEGKSIFDAIEQDKEAAVAKTDVTNRRAWQVTPNVGPVFYNSLGEGSSIDPTFADNSQSSDVNFSYGVQVSYNINNRLSIRSGVSNVNLGYSTGGIELGDSPVEAALQSVNFESRSSGRVLSAFDKGTLSDLPPPTSGDPLAFVTPKRTGGNAELIQNLSYYEVPMELNYALLDKRFGVNMIGGFSTLFLGDNEVSVQDGEFNEVLGEANNLNSVSFTTNVGLGFNYKISERLKFNIEPMFKYQLNPYTDSSVDFKPYYVGIYSGLSLKF